MPKYKLTKAIDNQLRIINGKLPVTYYESGGVIKYNKEFVLANPDKFPDEIIDELKANKDKPETVYLFNKQSMHPVNHYRRMKRIFINEGGEGIKRYVIGVEDVMRESVAEHNYIDYDIKL